MSRGFDEYHLRLKRKQPVGKQTIIKGQRVS